MKAIYTVICLLALVLASFAHEVKLIWDNNPPEDQVIAYYVWLRNSGESNRTVVGVSTTNSITLTNISSGSICFSVTASNMFGESGFSAEACVILPPHVPKGLQPPIVNLGWFVIESNKTTVVQWSEDLTTWRTDAPVNLISLAILLDRKYPKQQFWKTK